MQTSSPTRGLVRLVIQPTVSHYREPLIEALLAQRSLPLSLLGRYLNSEDRQRTNHIKSASEQTLEHVDELRFREWRGLRWETGIVSSVLRQEYRAYVLEGRVYTVSTWLALLSGRLRGVPVFLWGHGWKRPEDGAKRAARVAFYKLSSGLLTYGQWARNYALSVGLSELKVATVGNSIYPKAELVRHELSDRSEAKPNFNIIVTVRLTSRHRVDLLAQAIERMNPSSRSTRVVIVGDGDQLGYLKTQFSERHIHTEFVGAVYGSDDLARVYGESDVAVSPRASGLNVVQAMGFGRPVVAPIGDPTSGPEAELVKDGVTGLNFKLDDIDGLARALETLRDHPHVAARFGREGRDSVLRTHTAEAHSEAMVTALESWLARGV